MARTKFKPSEDDLIQLPRKDDKDGDLPEDEKGWISYIKRVHDESLENRKKFELQWTINLCYYMGYQELRFDTRSGIIRLPQESRTPLTVNRIGSFVEARHAKRTKQLPVTRIIPNSSDLEDQRAAKYTDQALQHLARKIRMESVYDKTFLMDEIFGTSFVHTNWNPRSGDVLNQYKRSTDGMELIVAEDGTLDEESIFEGEVSSLARSPFSILPANDHINEVRDQPYMIEITHLSVSELEEMYPHIRGEIKKQDREETFTNYERMVHRLGSPFFYANQGEARDARDSLNSQVRVITYWQKPNYQYEKGVLAVIASDQLCMINTWPNDFGDTIYPIVKFAGKDNGIHFWGQSTIERLIPIQRAYNRIRQHVDRNAALMAKGKWMTPKGSQLAQDALDDDSGEVVEYNSAVPEPHQAPIQPLPNYIVNHQESLVLDFRDASGQRETTMTPASNLTAGVAMQLQAELQDEILGPILRRQAMSMQLVANTQLMLIDQEWVEPRLVKIFGEGNRIGVQWFSNADFRHHTDVHVEVESLWPDFRGQKRQTLMDFWDRRIIQDPKVFLRAFRYGNYDEIINEEEKIEDSVVIEIEAMKRGKEVPVHPFQNHLLYIRLLSQFVQTPEFLRLREERKQLFIQNLQAHISFVMSSLPQGGAPIGEQNPAAVGTPFGAQKPVGAA